MSVIEQAAKRLAELRKAGIVGTPAKARTSGSPAPSEATAQDTLAPGPTAMPARQATLVNKDQQRHDRRPPTSVSKQITINFSRLAELGFVSPESAKSRIAEEFRLVKRPIIGNAIGKSAAPIKNANLVMVTSALPGEGKTSSAVNLAISMAMEMDRTVLLVDADVAKPSVPQMLGLSLERGLLDVLLDNKLDLSEVLFKTNIEKLALLPSGRSHPRATELLASDVMGRLLDEMAKRYTDRILIFDSPPLLLTTEARALAAHMGQIVVVVEAERTTHMALRQALAMIDACPVRLLMLNKSRPARTGSYYGYGGRGGYANYGYGG